MMIGETRRPNPTVQVPPWDLTDDPMAGITSPYSVSPNSVSIDGNGNTDIYSLAVGEALKALQRFLPSNELDPESDSVDSFSCDNFRMFEFKVRRCARGRSHDWTECPYAHPGEKARRRDPRKVHYSGTPCPDFRKGSCKRGDSCEFAHGVFECWLHPTRYRTQPCKDGTRCQRRVCFFAHTAEQLRVLPQEAAESYDGSPMRSGFGPYLSNGSFISSPTSTLISPAYSSPSDSPPMTPNSISELTASIRNLQLSKMKLQMGRSTLTRSGFCSLPTTPTRTPAQLKLNYFDLWENSCQEEPVMERVESGRDLRAKIYEKLSKENSLDRDNSTGQDTDVGWVSELLK